ncbi:hypothetical protein Ae201684P_019553 [Aphanomyces euteiches]|uniref:Uncharacterized protein n=1 Tax=Aphanomyces euteiches TaxID=100861 RepID=A0A6G0XEH7_9STRA|nr:hypothetical protein Ae201684_005647 [Aphanomyces euteiches]KAH9078468.1 hypothetical protein Ae201684P_019553 [Aphanomyces euteiches]
MAAEEAAPPAVTQKFIFEFASKRTNRPRQVLKSRNAFCSLRYLYYCLCWTNRFRGFSSKPWEIPRVARLAWSLTMTLTPAWKPPVEKNDHFEEIDVTKTHLK